MLARFAWYSGGFAHQMPTRLAHQNPRAHSELVERGALVFLLADVNLTLGMPYPILLIALPKLQHTNALRAWEAASAMVPAIIAPRDWNGSARLRVRL